MTRPAADIFAAIASASAPLTLARTADGFLPLLLADLARASDKRLVYVATDDTAMQAVADAAPFFAPDLVVHRFPAWDCLPYDRAGPSMVSADRLATLSALQQPSKRGELVRPPSRAITQRTLTPFRIRRLATTLAQGSGSIAMHSAELLVANGFSRRHGRRSGRVCGARGILDRFPRGGDRPARSIFGDDRKHPPLRPRRPAQPWPREGAATASSRRDVARPGYDQALPLATATCSARRRRATRCTRRSAKRRRQAGMDHWLPLFEERLATLFDHIDPATPVLRATAATRRRRRLPRPTITPTASPPNANPGSYRPLAPETLYLSEAEWAGAAAQRPIHIVTPFDVPPAANIVDLETFAARDFTLERAADLNVYDKVADHLSDERRKGRKTIIASYSEGARIACRGAARAWRSGLVQAERRVLGYSLVGAKSRHRREPLAGCLDFARCTNGTWGRQDRQRRAHRPPADHGFARRDQPADRTGYSR